MASVSDFMAVGRVIDVEENAVVFQPVNTTYEWKLVTASRYDGPTDARIECRLTAKARKLYTVPSGGNFVQPIFGPPRILQGRIKHLEEGLMVVHGGAPFIVELPKDEDAYDMGSGFLAVGGLVNVVALPGARFELVESAAGAR